jgi:prepilin-type N-terminal cleavage/methylation domain-containing protein
MDKMIRTRRRGFTVVELLVVIAIIGVLMSLAIPGTLMARAAARRRHCLNRQGQLALGLVQYEENVGRLPPYVRSSDAGNVSWPVLLFEYMGRMDVGEAILDDPYFIVNEKPTIYIVEDVVCPASVEKGEPELLSYAANVGEWDGTTAFNGVFSDGSRKVMSDKMTGGSEHSMAITENLQAMSWAIDPTPTNPITGYVGQLGVVWSGDPAGSCASVSNATPCIYPNQCMQDAIAGSVGFARPSSQHPNGVGMAFLSGRTQFINDDVDHEIYRTWMLSNE